ncbi:hypothetical protein TWF506_008202 [Arthrobotrys conoides]|uniref:Uncharacterized protein n=1 Tax=Arthrobotrys conoides TaxID=74498 RepID=A0AAN8NE41_9PEZI
MVLFAAIFLKSTGTPVIHNRVPPTQKFETMLAQPDEPDKPEPEEWIKITRNELQKLEHCIDHALRYLSERPFNLNVCQGAPWAARMNIISQVMKNHTDNICEKEINHYAVLSKVLFILENLVKVVDKDPRLGINAPSVDDAASRISAKLQQFSITCANLKYPEMGGIHWDSKAFDVYIRHLNSRMTSLCDATHKRVANLNDERTAGQLLKAKWKLMKRAESNLTQSKRHCKCMRREIKDNDLWEKRNI